MLNWLHQIMKNSQEAYVSNASNVFSSCVTQHICHSGIIQLNRGARMPALVFTLSF